jgi:hypothetical protein
MRTWPPTPRYVIKDGMVIVEEGHLRRAPAGRRPRVAPGTTTRLPASGDISTGMPRCRSNNHAVSDLPGEPVVTG